MVDDDSLEIAVVEHDERLVASCMLSVTESLTRGARPFALVENAVTHEDHRQNGFGKLCVRAAIDVAERENYYKVMVMTRSDREWKREFYERCDFDSEEKTGVVCGLRDD